MQERIQTFITNSRHGGISFRRGRIKRLFIYMSKSIQSIKRPLSPFVGRKKILILNKKKKIHSIIIIIIKRKICFLVPIRKHRINAHTYRYAVNAHFCYQFSRAAALNPKHNVYKLVYNISFASTYTTRTWADDIAELFFNTKIKKKKKKKKKKDDCRVEKEYFSPLYVRGSRRSSGLL